MPPKVSTRAIGQQYEEMALEYLKQQGLLPVTRNFLCAAGEIDCIMTDGKTLVFVEVRYRKQSGFGSAIDTISTSKQQKLLRTARHFLVTHPHFQNKACRFDVIGIDLHADGTTTLNWIKHAFME